MNIYKKYPGMITWSVQKAYSYQNGNTLLVFSLIF